MDSPIVPKASYTPEYSEELLALVVELYKDEIKQNLNELQLSKMIDLIDIAQHNIEQYTESLSLGNYNRCLKFYIVGLFYIYLVIPTSIQFQIKNKNYEIFLFLKQLYEREINMSNVKLQVVRYIGFLNDMDKKKKQTDRHEGSKPKRALTLPSSTLHNDLTELLLSQDESINANGELSSNSSFVSDSSESLSSSINEQKLWTPPKLQPNDQLQLVDDSGPEIVDNMGDGDSTASDTTPILNEYLPSTMPTVSPPPALPLHLKRAVTDQIPSKSSRFSSSIYEMNEKFPSEGEEETEEKEPDLDYFKIKTAHRKDSYHSVYANDEDESVLTVDSKSMYNSLLQGDSSCLLFDIRPKAAFDINHIPYDDIIQLDPSIVLNSMNYQEFEDSLRVLLSHDIFQKFKNLKRYDSIVSYSDNKTFFQNKHDYIVKFSNLLEEINVVPKTLSGGFDKWLRFISKTHLNTEELRFKAKVPMFNIPEVPSVPPPPLPTTQGLESKTYSFDYSKMFPERNGQIHQFLKSPSPTSQISGKDAVASKASLVPIGRAPLATPAYPSSSSGSTQNQRPAQPRPTYPSSQYSSNPFPVNHYYQPITSNSPNFSTDPKIYYQYQEHRAQQYYEYTGQSHHQNQYDNRHPKQIPSHYLGAPRAKSRAVPTIQDSVHPFVRMSITGLRNMKNTCYINSMIQCLFESRNLRDLFLDHKFQDYYNEEFFNVNANNVVVNFNGNSRDPSINLSTSLAKLFEKMYLYGGCSIVPSGFLKNCAQLRPDLNIPFEQQDTQEFLMFLLDRLHDELSNSNRVINDYPDLMEFDMSSNNLGHDYEKWFNNVLVKQGFSPISQNFQGQLQDSLTCMNCGFKSSNYSSFYMLSLGIPKTTKSGKKLKKIGLEDCIDLFTHDEILSGDNAWDCPKCSAAKGKDSLVGYTEKEPRRRRLHFKKSSFRFRGRSSSPAPTKDNEFDQYSSSTSHKSSFGQERKSGGNSTIKSLTFVVLPPTLIVHLSRFLFYDTSQKDDSVISYPLILTIQHNDTPVKYRLFGVVNHSGTLKSGHYTSITNKNLVHDLNEPNWYYFDDEVVKETKHGSTNRETKDDDRMSSSNVYVLFYEKV